MGIVNRLGNLFAKENLVLKVADGIEIVITGFTPEDLAVVLKMIDRNSKKLVIGSEEVVLLAKIGEEMVYRELKILDKEASDEEIRKMASKLAVRKISVLIPYISEQLKLSFEGMEFNEDAKKKLEELQQEMSQTSITQ